MDRGFLDFNDEDEFDFPLSLDDQHKLLAGPPRQLVNKSLLTNCPQKQLVNNDFDYVQRMEFDSNALWETEQELNGDLAVLPVSGVSTDTPKVEIIEKEDFEKVLTDWHEHIGYLQATELEEDIDMVPLDMGLSINVDMVNDIPENLSDINILSSPVKLEENVETASIDVNSSTKAKTSKSPRHRVSESDQSEKEIDVVGLDSFEEINSNFDYMHVQRQHVTAPPKAYNCKILGSTVIKIKQEVVEVKEASNEYEDKASQQDLSLVKTEHKKSNKKKSGKKHKEDSTNKKGRRSNKETVESVAKNPKKSKKQIKNENIKEELNAPVLEAGDVKSLLEQFEATVAAPELFPLEIPKKCPLAKSPVNKTQTTNLKKSADSQDSRLHKDIRDSLPKEVIDRIKASGRKSKTISIIPAKPNTKTGTRKNGKKVKEAAPTPAQKKVLKKVSNNNNNSNARTEGSVRLDHDYCSNSNSTMSSSSSISSCDSNSEYDRRMSDSEPQAPIKEVASKKKNNSIDKRPSEQKSKADHKLTAGGEHKKNWSDSNSKKDSGMESGDLSDASEEQQQQQQPVSSAATKPPTTQESSTNTGNRKSLLANKAPQPKPVYEMKIQSALATSILQLRNGVITKTKSLEQNTKPKQQMVSVLKKPPMATTPQKVLGANLKESIVTTTNSSNDQVQNIIVQDTTEVELPEETEKKPPRRKLNLAEYRSRREQNDGSRTSSPVQPMVLVYIHHVSTNTEPINDDPDNPIWSEREIVSVLKPKVEVEEEKVRPKPVTRDRGIQTMETVFGIVYEEKEEEEEEAVHPVPAPRTQIQTMTQTETQTEPEMYKMFPIEEIKVQKNAFKAVNAYRDVVVFPGNSKDVVPVVTINQDAVEEGEVPECEAINDEVTIIESVNNKAVQCNTVSEKEVDSTKKVAAGEEKASQNSSLSRARDRRNRNYRRARSSSSSSRSRSRSRSRGRATRRARSQSRSRSRSRVRGQRVSRSRSRGKARNERSSRSRSRSPSSVSSRSRSRSRSRRQRNNTRGRRRVSRRRSSVSSISSWYSRSRSRSRFRTSSSRSRSRSTSRSRSSRYSSCSRFSSRSYFGRRKWSPSHRKGHPDHRRRYNRHRYYSSGSSHGYSDWRRSPLPYRRQYDDYQMKEKQRQVEERRVIYVGRLEEGITKAELRRRFEVFGPVADISLHFRERGHNYGFVTFVYKNHAYQAVEHGNDDPSLPRYDLCFGGRRAFCKVKYADLDGAAGNVNGRNMYKPQEENTFDLLLKEAQAKLRKRKV